jgi:hypothetical protein
MCWQLDEEVGLIPAESELRADANEPLLEQRHQCSQVRHGPGVDTRVFVRSARGDH